MYDRVLPDALGGWLPAFHGSLKQRAGVVLIFANGERWRSEGLGPRFQSHTVDARTFSSSNRSLRTSSNRGRELEHLPEAKRWKRLAQTDSALGLRLPRDLQISQRSIPSSSIRCIRRHRRRMLPRRPVRHLNLRRCERTQHRRRRGEIVQLHAHRALAQHQSGKRGPVGTRGRHMRRRHPLQRRHVPWNFGNGIRDRYPHPIHLMTSRASSKPASRFIKQRPPLLRLRRQLSPRHSSISDRGQRSRSDSIQAPDVRRDSGEIGAIQRGPERGHTRPLNSGSHYVRDVRRIEPARSQSRSAAAGSFHSVAVSSRAGLHEYLGSPRDRICATAAALGDNIAVAMHSNTTTLIAHLPAAQTRSTSIRCGNSQPPGTGSPSRDPQSIPIPSASQYTADR